MSMFPKLRSLLYDLIFDSASPHFESNVGRRSFHINQFWYHIRTRKSRLIFFLAEMGTFIVAALKKNYFAPRDHFRLCHRLTSEILVSVQVFVPSSKNTCSIELGNLIKMQEGLQRENKLV